LLCNKWLWVIWKVRDVFLKSSQTLVAVSWVGYSSGDLLGFNRFLVVRRLYRIACRTSPTTTKEWRHWLIALDWSWTILFIVNLSLLRGVPPCLWTVCLSVCVARYIIVRQETSYACLLICRLVHLWKLLYFLISALISLWDRKQVMHVFEFFI